MAIEKEHDNKNEKEVAKIQKVISANEKSKSRIRRFRAIVRKVINNLFWLDDPEDDCGQDIKSAVKKLITKKRVGILNFKDKVALMHPVERRSDKDRQRLNNIVSNLKCFRRYPQEVKSKLSDYTHFVYLGPNRTIVREGNEGWAMYFVTSGEILVKVAQHDPLLNVTKEVVVATMKQGAMFGEVSLLHDIPRTATITTIDHVELLEINKTDFNHILKSSVMDQWIQVQNVLHQFEYFKEWDSVTIRECCILARLENYRPDDVILGDGHGNKNCSYFVSSGKVRVITKMTFEVTPNKVRSQLPRYKYIPGPEALLEERHSSQMSMDSLGMPKRKHVNQAKKKSSTKAMHSERLSTDSTAAYIETKFMEVAIMDKLSCFGIGEDWRGRRYAAATDVLVLKIPHFWLMRQLYKGNVFQKIAVFLNNAIPKTKAVFDNYVNQQRWLAYRRSLFLDAYKKKQNKVITTITDVPYSIRISTYM